MKGNARTRSPKVGEELSKVLKRSGVNYKNIASKTMQPEESIAQIFEEGALPSNFYLFMSICRLIHVPEKTLNKFKTSDLPFIYTYWDVVRPDAPSSDYFGRFLKQKFEETGMSRQELVKLTGKTPGNLSNIFNCKAKLSWPTLTLVLSVIGITPKDFLDQYEKCDLDSYNMYFHDTLENARKIKHLSTKEVASDCDMTVKRYEKIESGSITVFESELSKISTCLGIPIQDLSTLAKRAGILSVIKASQKKPHKKLIDLLNILSSYKYIDSDTCKAESHTVVTLIFLILLNKKGEYQPFIMYYLNMLSEPGNIALKMYSPMQKCNCTDVLNLYRENQGYTYSQLSKETGVSQAAIFEFFSGRSVPYIKNVIKLCDFLGAPLPLAIEYMIGEASPKRNVAEFVDVIATLDTAYSWTYNNSSFNTNDLEKMFRIIFSEDTSVNKYKKLISLGILAE